MNQKRLALSYVLNTAVITHLAACKRTSGLNNPDNKVDTSMLAWPVWLTPIVFNYHCKSKLSQQSETRPYTLWNDQKKTYYKAEELRGFRFEYDQRPGPKGFKLRFGYDQIAPSGCGDANQEGTDSYVLFGSNTTHVWTGSPQVILKIV